MKLLIIIIVITIIGCKETMREKSKLPFEVMYYRLPLISLPLKMQTSDGFNFSNEPKEITDTIVFNYFTINDYEYPIGRIFNNEQYYTVLSFFPSDVGTPVIKTYSKEGNVIDSLWIFDEKPTLTIGLISNQYATITSNQLVQFVDSSFYIDSLDNVVDYEIIKKTYCIESNGKIVLN